MSKIKLINSPLTFDTVKDLKAGDEVLLTGTIYTARDAAHKRLVEAFEKDGKFPFDLDGQVIYYVGPTPAWPGKVIGSAGPTTSYRMDAYAPTLIRKGGLKGMIGKGARNQNVIDAMKEKGAIYFVGIGGAGALMSKAIKKAEVILYDDLGAEAIRKLYVENFPAIVATDSSGLSMYDIGPKQYKRTNV